MKPFYILAVSMGETLYGLFDSFLGFPSWIQVQRYQDGRCKVLGLHEDIFSLSLENFRSLARRYMPDSSDTRVCLAIDAVSHKSHILIDPRTGRVAGLTEPLVLAPHTIDVLANDPDAFGRFLRDCALHLSVIAGRVHGSLRDIKGGKGFSRGLRPEYRQLAGTCSFWQLTLEIT
jgi:hypothetical protein